MEGHAIAMPECGITPGTGFRPVMQPEIDRDGRGFCNPTALQARNMKKTLRWITPPLCLVTIRDLAHYSQLADAIVDETSRSRWTSLQ